jgi:hypothetical protein
VLSIGGAFFYRLATGLLINRQKTAW